MLQNNHSKTTNPVGLTPFHPPPPFPSPPLPSHLPTDKEWWQSMCNNDVSAHPIGSKPQHSAPKLPAGEKTHMRLNQTLSNSPCTWHISMSPGFTCVDSKTKRCAELLTNSTLTWKYPKCLSCFQYVVLTSMKKLNPKNYGIQYFVLLSSLSALTVLHNTGHCAMKI